MTTIYSYVKYQTPHTTIQMAMPESQGLDAALHCTELCTLDGITYVAVPDGVTLPSQPLEIDVQPAVLTDELREQIKEASPHVALIDRRMIEQIRASYSIDDEMYFARIGVVAAMGMYQPSSDEVHAMIVFGEYVEAARQWGRVERAKLGL